MGLNGLLFKADQIRYILNWQTTQPYNQLGNRSNVYPIKILCKNKLNPSPLQHSGGLPVGYRVRGFPVGYKVLVFIL